MARTKSSRAPKVKLTITLEPAVIKALGSLRTKLEAQAYGNVAKKDLQALHGPLRHTQSSVVEMAILALCAKYGVVIKWVK